MTLLFTICAVVGGTLFVLQFLLSLLGFGGGHDVDAHGIDMHHAGGGGHAEGTSWLFGMLSFRAVVSALTAFGLGGLAVNASGAPPIGSLGFAVFCALATMLVVAFMTHSMRKLEDDGTIHIQKAVGRTGTVYITIPAKKSGTGKVTVSVQNRTMEFQAITPNEELSTGTLVVVTAVVGSDTVEVTKAPNTTPTPEAPR
jgi:membrane protein implicated in regulation of membrane protease activity